MLKHARSFATSSICRPMSQLPIGTSPSVSTAGPIYPLSWTRISSKKPRPSPGGTACPCASSSRRGLDGRLLGELRFVEIRASGKKAKWPGPSPAQHDNDHLTNHRSERQSCAWPLCSRLLLLHVP